MSDLTITKFIIRYLLRAFGNKEVQKKIEEINEASIRNVLNNHPQFRKALNPESQLDDLLTTDQIEKYFGITPATRLKWEKKGALPASIKVLGRVYYLKSEVEKVFLKQRKVI